MTDDKPFATETSTEARANTPESETAVRFCPKCERSFDENVKRCPDDDILLVVLKRVDDSLVGKTIRDAFTLRKRIGKGGMGVVYLGWQHSVGREVAVKVMSSRINDDPEAAKRFFREANLACQLSHPNIVTVHDFGQDEDCLLYIVMEYLKGVTLREAMHQDEPFDLDRIHHVVRQLCDALEAAHDATIVHRDLKPANIVLLRKAGVTDLVKVLDFGIAKSLDGKHTTITKSGAILGTPAYMPPEVALDGVSDARSDLYSLGLITYQLLANRLPFVADDVRSMIAMHTSEPVPPLPDHIPQSVANVVYRLLEKEPDARYQSAAEVRVALADAMRGQSIAIETGDIATSHDVHSTTPATPGALKRDIVTATTQMQGAALADEPAIAPRRSRWPWIAIALVAVAGAALLAVNFTAGNGPDSNTAPRPITTPTPALTDAAISKTASVPVDARVPASTDKPRTVRITITARRAKIFINGKPYPKGHAEVHLPRSENTFYVRIVRPGHTEWARSFKADRDRNLRPTLHRIRRHTTPSKKRHDAGTKGPWLDPE